MFYLGIDPGFSGAWGMIDHNGKYQSCGDMLNNGKHILSRYVHAEISQAIDRQDVTAVLEAVHAMPKQGVSSSFKFGMAYGAAISLAERFDQHFHLVPPHQWKKDLGLTSDKEESLIMARTIWPEAPLLRKKDNGRAEALLIALWYKKKFLDGPDES